MGIDTKNADGALLNHDRIAELYLREIWSKKEQDLARERVQWICSQVDGGKVLDVGCSQGIVAALLGQSGVEVTGIDLNERSLEYAKNLVETKYPSAGDKVDFFFGDILEYEPSETFTHVILTEVLEHFAAPDRLLTKVNALLEPNGKLIVTTPFGVNRDPDHKRTFCLDDLNQVLSKHFYVESLSVGGLYTRAVARAGREGSRFSKKAILEISERGTIEWQNIFLDKMDDRLRQVQEKNSEIVRLKGVEKEALHRLSI